MHLLTKDSEAADLNGVDVLRVGGAWDTSTGMSGGVVGRIKKRIGSDLDVVAILMSGDNPVRYCGMDNPDPLNNGSVLHSGDNTTGRGDGDDETVTVKFADIPPVITAMYFVITAFKRGSSFDRTKNVEFNVYDGTGGRFDQVAQIMPSLLGSHNAHKVARAFRSGSSWGFEVTDEHGTIEQGDTNSLLRFAMR